MLTISDSKIDMRDGLYSLNDLHKVSGGKDKHRPTFFLRLNSTKALIKEIRSENVRCADMHISEPVKVLKGIQADGTVQGTYVCRELVYSYAMWISPRFQLAVIRAFDSMTNQQKKLSERLNALCNELNIIDAGLTSAGRFLCIGGKQIKPQLEQNINSMLKQIQPSLELVGGTVNGKQ